MSEIESAVGVMNKTLQTLDKDLQKKIVNHGIFFHWKEIAGSIAKDIFPIKIVGDTIILYAETSVAKDNMKFLAQEIIDKANEVVGLGEEIFKHIDFAKSFERKKILPKKKIAPPQKKFSVEEIELTDEEISDCEKKVGEFKNPEIKKITLEQLINHKKLQKLKLQYGWHKCEICGILCAPEENICGICKIGERNKMRDEIQQLFYKNPQIKFQTVLEEIQKKYPHVSDECDMQVIDAERSALIRSIAARVSYGDRKSATAKMLVMLYRRLPEDKLTDAIINRTFEELKFDLADLPPFEERIKKIPTEETCHA